MKFASFGFLTVALAACAAFAEEPVFERVAFAVERKAQVENDRVHAVLAAQAQDADPAALADDVNQTMAWALERARAVSEVTARTGSYSTHQTTTPERQKIWVVSQQLVLEAGELGPLRQLLGVLQERLLLRSLGFSPSDEARRAAEEALVAETLEAFRARADLIRENLGFSSYRIVELSVGPGGGPVPMPRSRGMAMMAEAAVAPPALEAGTSDVQVTVRGTIQLQ